MRVECPACGKFVEVSRVPARCPYCSHVIEELAPRVLVYRKGGYRIERQAGTQHAERADDVLEDISGLGPPPGHIHEPAPYPIYRAPAAPRSKRTLQIVGIAVACLVVAYILVDYVRLRTRAVLSTATPTTAPSAAPTRPVSPALTQDPPPSPSVVEQSPSFSPSAGESTPAVASATPTPAPSPAVTAPPAPVPPAAAVPEPTVLRPVRAVPTSDAPTDVEIDAAIQRGVAFLLSQFDDQGNLTRGEKPTTDLHPHTPGEHALAALALIYANQATFDERLSLSGPFMNTMLQRLKEYDIPNAGPATYCHALRLMALSVPNRQQDRKVMELDLEYLLGAHFEGSYSYTTPARGPGDNSNSQYGVLGTWAAVEAGFHVPAAYWRSVEQHWTKTQASDGGWAYTGPAAGGTLAMTSAGVNMLFVARDQLLATDQSSTLEQAPFSPALQRGVEWLAQGNNAVTISGHPGYTLYGLERAGLASGFKRFGRHDWYKVLARQTLERQNEKGYWEGGDGAIVETGFAILFLTRGRHPLVMNKLRFDGAWANRPRDLVKLSRFVFESIERPVNWQVATLADAWWDWADSPILYLASHDAVPLSDEDLEKVRQFVRWGGLLFTQADADSRAFNAFAEELAGKLFPGGALQDLPEDHPIYSTIYPMRIKPKLRGLGNGSRLLMVHSPTDQAVRWQFREPDKSRPAFELGANVFVYATGKHPLRNRLDMPYLPEPTNPAVARASVARVMHGGNWDPEPGAWDRWVRQFRQETSVELQVKPAELSTLRRSAAPFAHLTTTSAVPLSEEELAGLRKYVEEGGVLFADVCGGSPDAADALRAQLAKTLPDAQPQKPPVEHPLLTASGDGMINLGRPRLRVFAVDKVESGDVPHIEIFTAGKGAVVFSRLDVVSGLLDTTTWGIIGYEPRYAQQLMNNVLLWMINGRGTPKTWTPVTTQPATGTTPAAG